MRRGFTLFELLVTIVIIGILASILIPTTFMLRDGAYGARCQNNERQLGFALIAYTRDWNGFFPQVSSPFSPSAGSWGSDTNTNDVAPAQYKPTYKNAETGISRWEDTLFNAGTLDSMTILRCPNLFNDIWKSNIAISKGTMRTYGANGTTGNWQVSSAYVRRGADNNGVGKDRPLGNRLGQVENPSKCLLIGESYNTGGVFVSSDSFGLNNRHLNGRAGVYGFVDGHVRYVLHALMIPPYTAQSLGVYTMTASDDATIPEQRY